MFLLAVIYIAFIGLGLPDSIFGTVWPAIYKEWNLPISLGSFIITIVYCGTMVSSLMSAKVIKRFGTGNVTAFSTALTTVSILAFSYSKNFLMLCLCAIPLGLGAGSIDTALNNYVSINYKAHHINFLHSFYGVGVVASPYIFSSVLKKEGGWRKGYLIVCIILAVITIILFTTLFLWKKKESKLTEEDIEDLPIKKIVKIKGVLTLLVLFVGSCAIEVSSGSYGSTYLVETKNIADETAASIIIFYYLGIALGRFISGLIAHKLGSKKIIFLGELILGAGILFIIFSKSLILAGLGLSLIGFGNGPLFPNFSFITPIIYGETSSPSIIGMEMAISSLTFMIIPILCGLLGQLIGMIVFPFYISIFYILLISFTFIVNKQLFVPNGI